MNTTTCLGPRIGRQPATPTATHTRRRTRLTAGWVAVTSVLVQAATLQAVTDFERLPDLPHQATVSWFAVWGDYDRDGFVDLAVANGAGSGSAQTIDLYRNRGDRTFERQTAFQAGDVVTARGSWGGLAWADMDNDGFLDLIAASTTWAGGVFHAPCVFRNQKDGSFRHVAAGDFSAAASGFWHSPPVDLNGDGNLDILATGDPSPPSHFLFWNRGDGSFRRDREAPIVVEPMTPNLDFWADIDGDGDIDVFAPNLTPTSAVRDRLYLNDGRGRLVSVTDIPLVRTTGLTFHGAFGDYDQDGDLDCVLIKEGPPLLFRNDAGSFVPIEANLPRTAGGASMVDYDNDGLLDLYLDRGQGSSATNSLLRNLGDGSFESIVNLLTTQRATRQGSTWGDLDNDGFLDLVEVSPQGGTRLFRNLGNGHHWLKLRLKGASANADGIGAVVRVRATIAGKAIRQMRQVGGTTVGQHDLRPAFGLGDAMYADEVRIEWPSGNVQTLVDVAADQILVVTEDTGITPSRPVVTVNGDVRLTGHSTGTARHWSFEGRPLPDMTNATLTLTSVRTDQAGRYTLTTETDGGPVTSSVTLRVLDSFVKILAGPVIEEALGSQFATWFDADKDGALDLFVANSTLSPRNSFFRNAGQGDLVPIDTNALTAGPTGAMAAAVGDFDNDGRTDLFIPMPSGRNALFRNEGGGAFASLSSPPLTDPRTGCITGSWSDYNNDGRLDLHVAYGYFFDNQRIDDALFRGLGDGHFATIDAAEVGDVVDDSLPTWWSVWFDADGDGAQDLLVVHGGVAPRLHRNNRDGTFTRLSGGSLATAWGDGIAAVADFDNDGKLDVFLTRGTTGTSTLHRNLGNGAFADQTAQAGIQRPGGEWPQVSWVDYDNDGWLDLFLTTYETNALYRSRGDGTFQFVDVGNLRTDGARVSSSAWGDFDGDGFPDILLPCGDTVATRNHLYRGGTNGNHWLKVRLVGTTSNRDGIGAKVRVRATLGGRTFWQLREVSGNAAPGGAQQLLPHFGLGNSTRATLVRVEWPSGIVQELASIPADQTLEVVEPPRWSLAARTEAGAVQLDIRGPAQATALLQESSNLRAWTDLVPVTTDAAGTATVASPVDDASGLRFFRVLIR